MNDRPNDWLFEPLSNFVKDMGDGGTPSRAVDKNFGGDVPWVVISDFKREIDETAEHLTSTGFSRCTAKLWPQDTVILSTGATIGKVGIAMVPLATKQGITGLVPNERITSRFLYYKLLSKKQQLNAWSQGSTFAEIRVPILSKIPFEVPKEKVLQETISDILESADQTIEKTETLIEKYQQIKAGLMHDLFTRGIDPDGKLRPPREEAPQLYQETAIGWIPTEWGVDEFGINVDVIDPNPSHRYPPEVDEGFPICSTENFVGEDGFNFDRSKRVPWSIYTDQNLRCRFKALDVVFARKGKIGMARRYGEEEKVFSHTVVLMKPSNEKVDPFWLLWLARSDWFLGGIDITMNTNSGVPTLGVDFIKSVSVPFPQPEEQCFMAKLLDIASSNIAIEIERKEKLVKQRSGLMHDLLTGKVQVKSDLREVAND